jgi:uncharacterized LabA/DUF88 family protein
MTDVKIATELLVDAFDGAFDTAIVLSGDSDLAPPIEAIRGRWPDKRIIVAFPPKRRATQLQHAASEYLTVSRAKLAQSQLPGVMTLPNGHQIHRPPGWR